MLSVNCTVLIVLVDLIMRSMNMPIVSSKVVDDLECASLFWLLQ